MPRNSRPVAASTTRPPAQTLVLATANEGKRREFANLLADLPFALLTQASLGVGAPEETGRSFRDNALLKAHHAQAASGCAVLADDSGLEVDALGGAPGIYSARYAGPGADDAANNAKLLAQLQDVPLPQRTARYRCVLVFLGAERGADPLITEGVWDGCILCTPRGAGGFGYDPYFFVPSLGVTAAELGADAKNRMSHRGLAMQQLRRQLAQRFA
jgi:XTP/dITP diphosphohydrolase